MNRDGGWHLPRLPSSLSVPESEGHSNTFQVGHPEPTLKHTFYASGWTKCIRLLPCEAPRRMFHYPFHPPNVRPLIDCDPAVFQQSDCIHTHGQLPLSSFSDSAFACAYILNEKTASGGGCIQIQLARHKGPYEAIC